MPRIDRLNCRDAKVVDMNFIFNARLRRWQYWLSLIGLFIGLIVLLAVLISARIVDETGINGATLLVWLPIMGWAIAARARDAGRNVVGWTLAGLFVPFCWIIIGCFASTTAVYDQAQLARTFE